MACYLCQQNLKEIDFKDVQVLNRFISKTGRIKPRKKTGACSKHQRKLSQAIKRARYLALV